MTLTDPIEGYELPGRPLSTSTDLVCIQTVWPRWPLLGRQTTLNAATLCVPMSTVSAAQQRNGQVADARDTVYGSDGSETLRQVLLIAVWDHDQGAYSFMAFK